MRKTNSLKDRFWSYVSLPHATTDEDCWEWIGFKDENGYGRISHIGKNANAQTISMFLRHGTWTPKGKLIRHHCDMTACINPNHLAVGTYLENSEDMYDRGRNPDRSGEKNGMCKLSKEDVLAIRSAPKIKGSGVALAEKYKVTPTQISYIRAFKNWRSI